MDEFFESKARNSEWHSLEACQGLVFVRCFKFSARSWICCPQYLLSLQLVELSGLQNIVITICGLFDGVSRTCRYISEGQGSKSWLLLCNIPAALNLQLPTMYLMGFNFNNRFQLKAEVQLYIQIQMSVMLTSEHDQDFNMSIRCKFEMTQVEKLWALIIQSRARRYLWRIWTSQNLTSHHARYRD